MLEKIMDLHLLLYAMVVLGGLGALGMLATHLTYRRLIRKNTETRTNLKEKWMNLWKTRDKLLNRMNRLVWYPSLFCTALLGAVFFSLFGKWRMGWYAAGISVCGCDHPCIAAFAKTGTGFYVQGRTSYEYAF